MMYSSLLIGLAVSTLAGVATAGLVATPVVDASVPLPSTDSFYVAPANISSYVNGEVIRSRQVGSNLNGYYTSSNYVHVNSSHQYMYRSTDSLGAPVAAVMTLLIPNNPDFNKLWAHAAAYDSNNLTCAPSYALRAGANETSAADIILIAAALNNGWNVMVPDFHGLYGQFGAGIMAGHAILDGVRAALHGGHSLGLSPSPNTVLWGYSGGSIGAEWAVDLQPSYAPEVKFVGAAYGGLASNFVNVLQHISGGVSAGLGFAGLIGIANAYPDFKSLLQRSLIPAKKAEFYSIGSGCLGDISSAGSRKDIWSYFWQGQAILNDPAAQNALKSGGLAGQRGKPSMPLYIIEAVTDEIQATSDSEAYISSLCQKGATLEYHRDYYGEHLTEVLTEGPTAFQWLADRLDGKPLRQPFACYKRDVFVNTFQPNQYPALAQVYLAIFQTIYGNGNMGNAQGITG